MKNRYTDSATSRNRPLIALSFFSGAMGLDLGIEKAGFEIKLCCEVDRYCRQTIRLNSPDVPLLANIYDYSVDQIRAVAGLTNESEIDLVVGGPPCQAFSTAGRRKGLDDERGNVFLKFLDLALALSPKYIVIENVRGLLSSPMKHGHLNQLGRFDPPYKDYELRGGALDFVLRKLKSFGYGNSFNLYNSANYGTPQIRERVIILSARDGTVSPFLQPTNSIDGSHGRSKWNTLRTAIQGIKHHTFLNFPEKRLKYYKMLREGQNWRSLPEEYQQEAMGKSYYSGGGRTGFYRRLSWDKPSPTLVTHPAMPATDLAHPEEDRPLSIQEYKRIQEFPDNWRIAGNLIQQYKQIGNAVPIGLGSAVGKLIVSLIAGEQIINFPDFKYSRYKKTSHSEWQAEFERVKQRQNLLSIQETKTNPNRFLRRQVSK